MSWSRALIGRSAFSDILLEENGISRQHAFLIQDDDSLVVIDLRSRNGTKITLGMGAATTLHVEPSEGLRLER